MNLVAMEALAQQHRQELEDVAGVRRRRREARRPEMRARRVGTVIEMTTANPTATNRLLLAGGAVVVDRDERNGTARTIFANRSRTHFWVVVGA